MPQQIRYLSLFSGIGGFDEGIRRVFGDNAVCIGIAEIDKFAISIYNKHFKGVKNYGDATKLDTKELPDFDLLVGGFPCQAFSQAGNRKGFLDTRGTLFYEIARVCSDKRPRYLLLENVKGLLSHEDGKTFTTILGVFADLGYVLQWEVLNSCDFGVPQNRERVFIVGHLGSEPFREVFPLREGRTISQGENESARSITAQSSSASAREFGWTENAGALRARDYKDPKLVKIQKVEDDTVNIPIVSTRSDQRFTQKNKAPALRQSDKGEVRIVCLTEARTEAAKKLRRKMQLEEGRDYNSRRDKKLVPRKDNLANTVTASPSVEHLIIDPYNDTIPKDQKNSTTLRTNWVNGNIYVKDKKKGKAK